VAALTAQGPGSLSLRLGQWQEKLEVLKGWQKLSAQYSCRGEEESFLSKKGIGGSLLNICIKAFVPCLDLVPGQ
jgi:hypothetical protein